MFGRMGEGTEVGVAQPATHGAVCEGEDQGEGSRRPE